jgi:hypothetical protein
LKSEVDKILSFFCARELDEIHADLILLVTGRI